MHNLQREWILILCDFDSITRLFLGVHSFCSLFFFLFFFFFLVRFNKKWFGFYASIAGHIVKFYIRNLFSVKERNGLNERNEYGYWET